MLYFILSERIYTCVFIFTTTFSAPQFFTEAWLGKIKLDAANNWRLKVRAYVLMLFH